MVTKKVLSIGLAAAVLTAGCATTGSREQEWSHSDSGVSIKTKLTVGEHYKTSRCMVYAAVTNQKSSDIKGGSLNYTFFDESGTFKSSASVFISRGLPAGQTVVYETSLNESTGGKYYPYTCPKLQKLSIKSQLY